MSAGIGSQVYTRMAVVRLTGQTVSEKIAADCDVAWYPLQSVLLTYFRQLLCSSLDW